MVRHGKKLSKYRMLLKGYRWIPSGCQGRKITRICLTIFFCRHYNLLISQEFLGTNLSDHGKPHPL